MPINDLNKLSLMNTNSNRFCPRKPSCFSTKYRNADGSCNNLERPDWGKSFSAFGRLIRPQYGDGVNTPRLAKSGRDLPTARLVSYSTAPDLFSPSRRTTVMTMIFGQFIDHDLTRTAPTRTRNGESFNCCSQDSQRFQACLAIRVPENDPFYSRFETRCMNFVRSSPAPLDECRIGHREQMNQLTHAIDGSAIYGSTKDEQDKLRTFTDGKLVVQIINGEELLPPATNSPACRIRQRGLSCFEAGDNRVDENVGLAALQTLFLRHHNKIAAELKNINPGWNDEILYQETKRIIAAQIQHITYNEFLPVILGKTVMSQFGLIPLRNGFSNSYDPSTKLTVYSEFASAAYRIHTLIPSAFVLENGQGGRIDTLQLSDTFSNPSALYRPNYMQYFFYGMTRQRSGRVDNVFTREITNLLFKENNSSAGLDLVALNIQRGRDHGIPDYNTVRSFCGLNRIQNFEELANYINPYVAQELSRIYESVDDVDLFVGGFAENPLSDGMLGPTMSCIVARQFATLKRADRFWYENGRSESAFTQDQLREIRKTTLASLICENVKVDMMQLHVLLAPSIENPLASCNNILKPDLSFWRNEPVWS
ncbi:hypothetical protein B4U79_05548 [Dinothrombium tinctorium]|uniref:Peroxidase-like protein n=1 Tax=Dinothrombium tinctorium TaxID=1965070 RepID=A0A3S3NMK3_9ACAR|nr:hypothetical protein B4U79_05548 [Dinothrombium tinctorium]